MTKLKKKPRLWFSQTSIKHVIHQQRIPKPSNGQTQKTKNPILATKVYFYILIIIKLNMQMYIKYIMHSPLVTYFLLLNDCMYFTLRCAMLTTKLNDIRHTTYPFQLVVDLIQFWSHVWHSASLYIVIKFNIKFNKKFEVVGELWHL